MNSTRVRWLIVAGVTLAVAGVVWAASPRIMLAVGAQQCNMRDTPEAKADCWDGILRYDLRENGLHAALSLMKSLYETYPDFAYGVGGCHERGHALGSDAYLQFYLGGEKLSYIDTFGPDISLCSLGFLHGFMAQLFSNHPDPVYVGQVCDELRKHLSGSLSVEALKSGCFHGAGNGFIANALRTTTIPGPQNIDSFISKTYSKCQQIPGMVEKDLEDCSGGIFATLFYIYLPVLEDRDPEKNLKKMLSLCENLRSSLQPICYYPIGLRIASVAQGDPRVLAQHLIATISDKDMQALAFKGGMVVISEDASTQHTASPEALFSECEQLPQYLWEACAAGISRGIGFNTVAPHEGPDPVSAAFCQSSDVVRAGLTTACLTFGKQK